MVESDKPAELVRMVEDALDRVAIRESVDIDHGLVVVGIDKYMFELLAHNSESVQVAAVC